MFLRICHRLVAAASSVLPLKVRDGWREEWQGELSHRWGQMQLWRNATARAKLGLLSHAVGAIPDALWLRQQLAFNSDFLLDLRHGLRLLRKKPGFTLVAVLTLALGIGANTVIYSVVHTLLIKPLPYADSDRVAFVLGWDTKRDRMRFNISLADFVALQEQNQVFDQMGFHRWWSVNLTGDGSPERLMGYQVSANLFSLLGVEPVLGRTFSPEERRAGENQVVVLSHRFWARRFGSDRNVVGRTVTLNRESYRVVGVMPPGFEYPQFNFIGDLWTPMAYEPADRAANLSYSVVAVARVKKEVGVARAQAEVDLLMNRLAGQHPDTNANLGVRVQPLRAMLAEQIRPALLVLTVAVGLVLLIACANVANLILMRGITREKEMGIRTALGAGRLRLVRQLLAENLVIFLLGGVVALFPAWWGLKILVSMVPGSIARSIPSLLEMRLDFPSVGFSILFAVVAGLVIGLAPALQISTVKVQENLREGGRGSFAAGKQRLRNFLVVMEVALSLVLLVTTGLLVRSFRELLDVNPGFNTGNLLAMSITLPSDRYPGQEEQVNFFRQTLARIEAMPGAESAAIVNSLPFSTSNSAGRFVIEGRPLPEPNDVPRTDIRHISPGYFRTLGIPVLQGHEFSGQDRSGQPNVVVVNHTLARRYFPDEIPLGKRIRFRLNDPDAPWWEIVGVVGAVKHSDLRWEEEAETYLPFAQASRSSMTLAVRTSVPPLSLAEAARTAVQAVDPDQPVYGVTSMENLVLQSLLAQRFALLLMIAFAGVALTLATVGLYGVIAYSAGRRTHEIGIRMALGAKRASILRMVLGQGLGLVLIGIGIGLAATFAVTRFLESMLFGVSPTDPLALLGGSAFLALVALLACYVPARRATKVDPMVALRYE